MIVQRAFKPKEINLLNNEIGLSKQKMLFFLKWFVIFFLVFSTVGLLAYLNIRVKFVAVLLIAAIGLLISGACAFLQLCLKEIKIIRNIEKVINQDNIISVAVKSDDFIQYKQSENDFYLFQLPGKKIMYIGGKEFKEDDFFPNSNFEVHIAKDESGSIFYFKIHFNGPKIMSKLKLAFDQKIKFSNIQLEEIKEQNLLLKNIAIITGNIDELEIV